MKPQDHKAIGSWVFGGLLLLFMIWAFSSAPDQLPAFKQRILAFLSSLLAGLFGFFITGDISIAVSKKELKTSLKATGGAALFLVMLWWWNSSFPPVVDEKPSITIEKLHGVISDENQQPLKGVSVWLEKTGETLLTPSNGYYEFNNFTVNLDEVTKLKMDMPAYASRSELIQFSDIKNKNIKKDFTLHQLADR